MTTLSDLLRALAAGDIPREVPADCEYREEAGLLVEYLAELSRFTRAMAAGELSATLLRRGSLAGSLKGLHANLRHLTWQTQQVAAGDFTQKVDFLGEFSVAFNSMVAALAQARDDLVTKNKELAVAYNDLKAAEAQLLQQEKMASVGQLAAGIAHEINNPMGFIMSNLGTLANYASALQEYVKDADLLAAKYGETEKKRLAELRSMLDVDFIFEDTPTLINESTAGAKRVRDIVQTLKSFSHVDEAEVQQININDCVRSTVETAAATLRAKANVITEFGELPLLNCRPHELSQLFLNMLVNAAQAIDTKGEIRIKTGVADGAIVVSITDTGCGIPPGIIGRIFEPFFTTRDVGKGTGLGLSMCYDIAKKHGGTIDVQSKVGIGSTFTVKLPLAGV
ncbi:MAG TPA: ATP-binding protein [Rhodocyclaceae bacterium]|nr:ATP-binding protein [Rhodocyclaceae bacterium]